MKTLAWLVPFGCTLLTAATLLWAVSRGLDLTDEGFYLIHLTFPDRYPTLYGFGNIYQSALGWCCENVLHWRFAKLLQGLLGGIIFAVSLMKVVEVKPALPTFWALLGMNFVSFALYLQTISYNDLNNFLAILLSACLLLGAKAQSKQTLFLALVGAGLCLGINFFNKATASVALLGWSAVFLIANYYARIWPQQTHLRWQFLALIAGLFLGFGVFFAFIKPFNIWYADYAGGLAASSQYMEPAWVWVGNYLKYLVRAVGFVVVLTLPWWVVGRAKKYKNAAIVLATLWTLAGVYETQLILGGEKAFSKLSLVYLSVIFLQIIAIRARLEAQKTEWRFFLDRNKQVLFVATFLFVVPFACSLGSTNSLTRQASFHLVFWGGVVVLLNSLNNNWRWISSVLSVLVLVQITTGTLNPYAASAIVNPKHPVTLQMQTAETNNIPELKGILLDSVTAASLTHLRQITDSLGFKNAIFYDLPALNYLTNTVSPGTDWFFFLYESHNCYVISRIDPSSRPLLSVLNHRQPGEKTLQCLAEKNVVIQKYRLAASLPLPTQADTLRVLAPQ